MVDSGGPAPDSQTHGRPPDRSLAPADWLVAAAGAVALVASFVPFAGRTLEFEFVRVSVSFNAWHGWGGVGALLVVATAAVWLVRRVGLAATPASAAGWGPIATAVAAIGTLVLVVRVVGYADEGLAVQAGGLLLIIAGLGVTAGVSWGLRLEAEAIPPQGAPPQSAPPQSAPPQSAPPQSAPPQGAPPQSAPPQGPPPPTMQQDSAPRRSAPPTGQPAPPPAADRPAEAQGDRPTDAQDGR